MRLLRALASFALLGVAAASVALAQDWSNLATVSMTNPTTPKLTNRYVCYTDGRDIRCDSPSLYVTTGGLVGINTTDPQTQLEVNGTISATNFIGNGSGLTGVVAGSSDRIVSGTNLDTRMVAISNTGYISITQNPGGGAANTGWFSPYTGLVTLGVSATGGISGTTGYFTRDVAIRKLTPLATLDVAGTISASDAVQVGTSSLACSSGIPGAIRYNGGSLQYCNGTSWTTLGTSSGVTGTGSATAVAFWSGGNALTYSDGFYWDNINKRLGIGTNQPNAALVVSSTTSNLARFITNGDGIHAVIEIQDASPGQQRLAAINFLNGAGLSKGQVAYASGYNYMVFRTNSAERVRIVSTGEVGVGTQSPTAALQVSGTLTVSNTGQGNTSPSLYVADTGLVGVGTSSPNAMLEVAGNGVPVAINSTNGNALKLTWKDKGAVASYLGASVANDFSLYAANSSALAQFVVKGSTGRVGISTTTPLAKLDVVGTISLTDALQLGQNTIACSTPVSGSIRYNTTSNTVQFCNGTGWVSLVSGTTGGGTLTGTGSATAVAYWSGASGLTYDTDGFYWDATNNRLGVGTNEPASSLHVAMDGSPMLRISGAGTSLSNAAFLSLERYRGTNATPDYTTPGDWLGVINFLGYTSERRIGAAIRAYADDGWGTTGADSPGSLVFLTTPDGAGTLQERVRVDSSGRMGIGTGSPTATLTVSGTISASDVIQVGQSSLACASPISGSIRYNTTSNTIQFCNGTGWTSLASGTTGGSALGDRIVSGTTNAIAWQDRSLTITTAGTQRVIVGENGNVGIGTNAPPEELSVYSAGSAAIRLGSTGSGGREWDVQSRAVVQGGHFRIADITSNTSRLEIDENGNIGVGTLAPAARLDVAGTISATNAIQLGQNTIACANGVSGSIRYNTTSNTVQFCNGTVWTSLSSGTTGAGVSSIASLTDVSVTSLAGRDYLRYDFASSKWVNISESAVMSTTTMVSGWPDAIQCTAATGVVTTLYLAGSPDTDGRYYYYEPGSNASSYYIGFNSNGSYYAQTTRDYTNCKSSIATISAAGRAFNFIGNSDTGGGGSALGDRITSGTHAVTVNTSSGYVSLSTSGTDWGYFSSGNSYLPMLTATKVSSTNISTTVAEWSGRVHNTVAGPGGNFIASGTTSVSASSDGSIRFATAGSERLVINADGSIQMGGAAGLSFFSQTTDILFGAHGYTAAEGNMWMNIDADNNATNNTFTIGKDRYINSGGTSLLVVSEAGTVTFSQYGAGTLTTNGSGVITASSDARLKDIRGDYTRGLADVMKLHPVSYRWKADSGFDDGLTYSGFTAQDVQRSVPEAVGKDGRGYLTLSDRPLVAALVNAVKELKAANDNTEQSLREEIDQLRRELRELKQANKK